MNRVQYLLSTSLLACAAAAQPAFAQEAGGQNEAAEAADTSDQSENERGIQEIVVTAERRSNTAQKTAASVSVRTGEEMLLQGRYELKNILEDVPGITGGAAATVSTSQGSGTDNPAAGLTIRGIQSNSGSGGSTTSTSAAAAIYVDDVYNGIGGSYDIERVEVLRGPQGTLYGRSATAGVVAITTGAPDATRVKASGALEIGNYAQRHYTAALNLPLIADKLALRISGNHFERNGYYSTEGDARATSEFRAKLLWTPTDNFSALLGYALQKSTTHSGGLSISQGSSPTDFVFTPADVGDGKNNFHQYWGNFNLDIGPVAITYIPAYRTWKQDATIIARSLVFNGDQEIRTPLDTFMTHELRVRNTNVDSKLQWQIGGMLYRNKLRETNQLFLVPVGPFAFKSDTRKLTTAEGIFAEGTYSFAPETRLTAGIRYDHTKIVIDQDYTSIIGATDSLSGPDRLAEFNNVNYKLRVEQDLTEQNLLYASISTGFSPGDKTLTQDNTFAVVTEILDAQTLTAYEIGSKNRFLDNHLQVNAAAFYYDYGAYQTASINTGNPATPTFRAISVPVKTYGLELEVQARPWANGTFGLNASYTRARYGEFKPQDAPFFSSKTVATVAPFEANISYDHRIDFGGDVSLGLRAAARYASAHDSSAITDQQAADGGSPYIRVPSTVLGDFNASLLIGDNLSISGYVRNVTDKRILPDGWSLASVIATPGAPIVIADSRTLSEPRTFGVILSFNF